MQYHRIEDNSLTSLNWLPDFQIPTLTMPSKQQQEPPPPIETPPDSVFEGGEEKEREELLLPLSPLKRCMNQTAEFEQDHWRYKNDPTKPPFSYTTIIYLAISSSRNDRVTLGEIYQWIKDHFMYYRLAETTWQNSVRHNLSLNEFFIKIPRSEGDPGKGSFWQINPDYKNVVTNEFEFQRLEELQNNQKIYSGGHKSKGKSRRKLNSTSNGSSSNLKSKAIAQKSRRCKSASSSTSTSTSRNEQQLHLPGDLDWVSLLNSQKMSCGSCTGIHTCQASFGSPVFATAGDEHTNCSPAMIPMSLPSRVLETPPTIHQPVTLYNPVLDDIMTSQESPAALLPSWAESRSQSPNISLEHPWVDSRERSRHLWGGSPESSTWTIGLPMSGYPPPSSSGTVPVAAQLI